MASRDEEQGEVDVPAFRIAVVGPLAPKAEFRTAAGPDRSAREANRSTLDQAFADIVPTFALDIEGSRIDFKLTSLRDFRPDVLLSAVEHEAATLAARGNAAAPARATPESSAVAKRGEAGGTAIDSILDQVDVGDASPSVATPSTPRDPVSALVTAVAKSARPPAPRTPAAAQNARETAARLLGLVLAHDEMIRLERLWRSVKLLVDHADKKRGAEVYLIPCEEEELGDVLDVLAEEAEGAFDVVVMGHELAPTAADVELAKRAADAGAAMQAAVLFSGSPGLLGASDLASLGRSTRQLSNSDDAHAALIRNAAGADEMRWLFVALNGPWLRAPWDAKSSRMRDVTFAQDPNDDRSWIAGHPAFALAALCAKSFSQTGWPTPITAPAVMIENLVVREREDRGHSAAIPVEAFVSDDAATEISRAGFVMFGSPLNRDAAYVRAARALYRPKGAAPKDAEATLSDALFVASVVRALRELAAMIPEGTPAEKVEYVAIEVLRDLLGAAPPPGPEIEAKARGNRLAVTIRPHRFAGVTLPELSLDMPLH